MMASLAMIKYQPPAHLKFPKFVFLLLFQFHKKDLLLLFQSFDQEGKDYIFQEQMGDISSRKQSKVLRKSLFGHMAQAYHYFCVFEIWVSFFDTIPFCYPLNQPAVASVRRRGCVCLHKIRRMVVGVLTFAHGANFCFGLFARGCILYVYSTLCVVKKFDFRSFFLVSSSYLKSSKTRKQAETETFVSPLYFRLRDSSFSVLVPNMRVLSSLCRFDLKYL